MEKITIFKPAFDKRDPVASKNYGIGSVICVMVLKGDKGAVHFSFSTGMFLDSTMREYAQRGLLDPTVSGLDGDYFSLNKPMGFDVGYHSPTPMFNGQEPVKGCTFITTTSDECFCDSSTMLAERYMDALIENGSDKIWEMLKSYYEFTFMDKTYA